MGGGVKNVQKNDPPFFWVKNHESFGFFRFGAEKVFPGPDSMGFVWGGVGRALLQFMHVFSHFCYVGGFGNLGDPVVPTLRGVSGDVVTVYAY